MTMGFINWIRGSKHPQSIRGYLSSCGFQTTFEGSRDRKSGSFAMSLTTEEIDIEYYFGVEAAIRGTVPLPDIPKQGMPIIGARWKQYYRMTLKDDDVFPPLVLCSREHFEQLGSFEILPDRWDFVEKPVHHSNFAKNFLVYGSPEMECQNLIEDDTWIALEDLSAKGSESIVVFVSPLAVQSLFLVRPPLPSDSRDSVALLRLLAGSLRLFSTPSD